MIRPATVDAPAAPPIEERRVRGGVPPPEATTEERLADRAGLHRTYVERGEVNLTVWSLIRLAAALGVDPAELVRGLSP